MIERMAMNTEKIYKAAYLAVEAAALQDYSDCDFTDKVINSIREKPEMFANLGATLPHVAAVATILIECKAEMAKANVKPSLYKGVHGIFSYCSDARSNFHGRYTDEEGRMCVCSGCHGVRLNTVVEDIPECKGGNLKRSYEGCVQYEEVLTLPTMKELSAHIKEHNAKEKALRKRGDRKPATYDFGEGKPLVNANYLMDFLNIFGDDCKVTFSGSITSPIYFVSDIGDGIICPIMKVA